MTITLVQLGVLLFTLGLALAAESDDSKKVAAILFLFNVSVALGRYLQWGFCS
jgi:hypothetical protein